MLACLDPSLVSRDYASKSYVKEMKRYLRSEDFGEVLIGLAALLLWFG